MTVNPCSAPQDICYREIVILDDGSFTITRGCKPQDECTEAEHFTDEPDGPCTDNGDGSKTCLMCDYFEETPPPIPPKLPWSECEPPPGMQYITARYNKHAQAM